MTEKILEIERIKVESSNVASLGYHDEKKIMALEMLNGLIYYYMDIPKKHFTEMINNHPAIGSYLHRNVKGRYRFTQIF